MKHTMLESLNDGRCELLWCILSLLLLLFIGERFGELPEDSSSFAGVSTSSRAIGFERLDASQDRCLIRLSHQDHAFALLRLVDDRFHIVVAPHCPAIPSFVSPALLVSFPYLDANEEIDLLVTGSLGY